MKKILIIFIIASVSLASCRKFLDINSDPDTPQDPDPTSVFPVLLSNIPGAGGERGTGGVQFDALWIGSYIQFWHANSTANAQFTWDQHGHNGHTADRAAGIWRLTYFGVGKNMEYCITEGIKNGQWDVVGAALALKAYLFQLTTNYHGDIIFNDAFKEELLYFNWDDQEIVYRGVDSLARLAVQYLSRTDFNPNSQRLTRGDIVHGAAGTTTGLDRWRKFAYGVLARNFGALINKSNYSADSVIKYADLAMASGADDFLIPFEGSRNADANIFGTFRDNMQPLRQSDYIVRLLDGRILSGNPAFVPANRDPRMRHMLAASADTTNGNGGYRGALPNVGDPNATNTNVRVRIPMPWNDSLYSNTFSGNFASPNTKFLFQNKCVFPIMTYSEMQFLKAEAALRKNDAATAYTAYRNGITGHFDFINRTSYPRNNTPLYNITQITAAERTSYLAGANVKQSAAALRLEDVMQQKFIALWGWGFVETWTDMRKYHYTDIDPLTTRQVYSGMVMPTGNAIFIDNGGKYAQRVRPRYNSEYVWNYLMPAAANLPNYHVVDCWFSKP